MKQKHGIIVHAIYYFREYYSGYGDEYSGTHGHGIQGAREPAFIGYKYNILLYTLVFAVFKELENQLL